MYEVGESRPTKKTLFEHINGPHKRLMPSSRNLPDAQWRAGLRGMCICDAALGQVQRDAIWKTNIANMRATALSGGHNYEVVLSDEARCLRCSWEPYHTIPKTKSTSKRECICRCRVGVAHRKSRWKLASLNIAKQPIVGIPEIRFGKPGADWSETNREEWDSLVRRHERRWWNRNNEGLSEIPRWSIEPARDSTTSAIESVYYIDSSHDWE
jgi:hypothetical protein